MAVRWHNLDNNSNLNQNVHHTNGSLTNEINDYDCIITPLKILFIAFYIFIIILGTFGNTIVLLIFFPFFQKNKQKAYNILIWYLSVFDLLATLIIIPELYEYITCYQNWNFGWFGCKLIYSTYYVTINLSICILILIAIDRYRNIVTPFKDKFQAKDIHGCVFLAILLCLALQWYQFHDLKLVHYYTKDESNIQLCLQNKSSTMYTIPRTITILIRDVSFLIIFFTTTLLIRGSLTRRDKRMRRIMCGRDLPNNQLIFKLVLIMGTTFSILVLPYDIWDCTMLISRMLPQKYHITVGWHLEILDHSLSILQMSNSVANFLIFAFKHQKLHDALSKLLRSKNPLFRQHVIRKPNEEYVQKPILIKMKRLDHIHVMTL